MQRIESFPEQLENFENSNLTKSLQDIARNVRVKPNFCIEHPNYKSLKLSVEVVERLQRLPVETKDKYLNQQLQFFLYGIYYNGCLVEDLLLSEDSDTLIFEGNLEDNNFLEIDPEFYQQLHTSNNGRGYFDPGWQVIGIDSVDGSLIVKKDSLTLYIESNLTTEDEFSSSVDNSLMAIKLPKNRVQSGFYGAVGNAGLYSHSNHPNYQNYVRVYFNLIAEGASAIMDSLTKKLNESCIPFYFKTLYNTFNYNKRRDCAVLYFEKENYSAVESVLKFIYLEHQKYFQAKIPLFTKMLAPGLALAEEPDLKFSAKESFGQNRCQIVARGLMEAERQGIDDPEQRIAKIVQNFSSLGISLQFPHLNANSEDIYTPFDL